MSNDRCTNCDRAAERDRRAVETENALRDALATAERSLAALEATHAEDRRQFDERNEDAGALAVRLREVEQRAEFQTSAAHHALTILGIAPGADVVDRIAELRAREMATEDRAERAERQAAAMREALTKLRPLLAYAHEVFTEYTLRAGEVTAALRDVDAALSPTAGADYVPRAELEQAAADLRAYQADVRAVAAERDAARAEVARVERERDEARARLDERTIDALGIVVRRWKEATTIARDALRVGLEVAEELRGDGHDMRALIDMARKECGFAEARADLYHRRLTEERAAHARTREALTRYLDCYDRNGLSHPSPAEREALRELRLCVAPAPAAPAPSTLLDTDDMADTVEKAAHCMTGMAMRLHAGIGLAEVESTYDVIPALFDIADRLRVKAAPSTLTRLCDTCRTGAGCNCAPVRRATRALAALRSLTPGGATVASDDTGAPVARLLDTARAVLHPTAGDEEYRALARAVDDVALTNGGR